MRAAGLGAALTLVGCVACSQETEPPSGQSATPASTCIADYAPCGGNPTGTWKLTDVCIEGDLNAALNTGLFGDSTVCAGAITSAEFTYSHSVDFHELCVVTSAGTLCPLDETGVAEMSYEVTFVPECFQESTGRSLSSDTCAGFQTEMANAGVSASCRYDGSNCQCRIDDRLEITALNGAVGYSVDGTAITFTYSEDRSVAGAFCVEGDRMTLRRPFGASAFQVARYARQ